jgi:hypothetical protein
MDRKTKVGILTAMQKVIKTALDKERAALDDDMYDALMSEGTEKQAVMLDGVKVGEVGWSFKASEPLIADESKFEGYLYANNLVNESLVLKDAGALSAADRDKLASTYPQSFSIACKPSVPLDKLFADKGGVTICTATGEIVDFIEWTGRLPKATIVRIPEPHEVLRRITPETVDRLLGRATRPLAALREASDE